MSASQRTPRSNARSLTIRQEEFLERFQRSIGKNGYPPSMREIGDAVGLKSLSSVTHQLSQLEKLGYIVAIHAVRAPWNSCSALQLAEDSEAAEASKPAEPVINEDAKIIELSTSADTTMVPLVGRIAAGGPILAEQSVEDVFSLPRQLVGHGELFMLKVSGDSMVDAAICDGDWVVVRRQQTADNGISSQHCSTKKPRSRRSASAMGIRGCFRRTRATNQFWAMQQPLWDVSSP